MTSLKTTTESSSSNIEETKTSDPRLMNEVDPNVIIRVVGAMNEEIKEEDLGKQ